MAGFFMKEKVVNKVLSIPVERISPNPAQPRREFPEDELQQLADSIRENGVLQPITVRRKADGSYELIAGERRLRASRLAEQKEIPAIVLDSNGRQSAVLAILENIQRKDLNIFEEAEALKVLIGEWGITQEEAARKLGKAQSTIANKLRLLILSEEERETILKNKLTERHARAILTVSEEADRREILRECAEKHMNVAQLERYILQYPKQKEKKPPKKRLFIVKDVRIFLNTINKAVEVMKNAGIPADTEKIEEEDFVEYRVRIPLHETSKG